MRLGRISGWVAMCVPTAALAVLPLVAACSGPQSLSVAIRPEDKASFNGAMDKAEYLAWKARTTGQTLEAVTAADEALSMTRNPFDANRDRVAVSRGALIYQAQCMSCHGETAASEGLATPVKHASFRTTNRRISITLTGGNMADWFAGTYHGSTAKEKDPDGDPYHMPAYKDTLTREQIWLALTYLQTLDVYAPKK